MRVLIGIAIVGSLAAPLAQAQQLQPIGSFTAICDDAQSVGFLWDEKVWSQSTFTKARYIVRKLADYSPGSQSPDGSKNGCWPNEKPTEGIAPRYTTGTVTRVSGCYLIARQGETGVAGWCTESYTESRKGWALEDIRCDGTYVPDILFLPNGPFSYRSEPGMLKAATASDGRQNHKDTFHISVGACSVIG